MTTTMTIEDDLWQCDECGEYDEHGSVIVCEHCAGIYWQCVECDREHAG